MNLSLYWKAHPVYKNTIIGICEELPDSFCYFYITQIERGIFWISTPSLSTHKLENRILLRDPMVARQCCLDYLNYNTKAVIEHQLFEMRRRSTNPIKSATYYEAFLESRVRNKPEVAPKKFFRKAG